MSLLDTQLYFLMFGLSVPIFMLFKAQPGVQEGLAEKRASPLTLRWALNV
jgi:hypothetical protein